VAGAGRRLELVVDPDLAALGHRFLKVRTAITATESLEYHFLQLNIKNSFNWLAGY
jgi:hypothetical protein